MLRHFRTRTWGRRWNSNGSAKPTTKTTTNTTSTFGVSNRSATPGTMRLTKNYGADKHEAEVDSTLARIIGSDWGDRSHQPVSLPMRIYWIVFAVVLGNGLYTYFAGKDESFLINKLKKKADEKMGVLVENECQKMAEIPTNEIQSIEKAKHQEVTTTTAASILNSTTGSSTTMPFLAPGLSKHINSGRLQSKEELDYQLSQLREQEKRLKQQIMSGEAAANEELEHQVRMIDVQKDQVKRRMKYL
ncbi:uncharacterized protein PHALS_09431 [Plasmopara halstedii]|uniref:Uncharacterized protein n=1 Tax=Plasmopara halstedii TaxID=4781 RepID=A0A0P1A529_PLAHL|nr:uncharacterized protein PHALS_09431 [Plasmopara halstedii]CEG35305.1 hypothetical protein PHALS_09431 [Plasmopara halstedii]|eukprot:XP_024571674.1 hypothetical protein PHALS_09431 [Plasmopara halstedii]